VVDRLNREVNVILTDPKIQDQLQQLSGTLIAGSTDDFARLIEAEVAKWAKVIKFANVKPI
jgi:tripartite-type tricarboxylate transporter receptor subunit TctC